MKGRDKITRLGRSRGVEGLTGDFAGSRKVFEQWDCQLLGGVCFLDESRSWGLVMDSRVVEG